MSEAQNPAVDYSQVDTVDSFPKSTMLSPRHSYVITPEGDIIDGGKVKIGSVKILKDFHYWLDETDPDKVVVKRAVFTDEEYIRRALGGRTPVGTWVENNAKTTRSHYININGQDIRHSTTEPAYTISDGTKIWYVLGKAHRRGEPAEQYSDVSTFYTWGHAVQSVGLGIRTKFYGGRTLGREDMKLYEAGQIRCRFAGPDTVVWEKQHEQNPDTWIFDAPSGIPAITEKGTLSYYKDGIIQYQSINSGKEMVYYFNGEKISYTDWKMKTGQTTIAETKTASDGKVIKKIVSGASWTWNNDANQLHNPDGLSSSSGGYNLNGVSLTEKEFRETQQDGIEKIPFPSVNISNKEYVWYKKGTTILHRKYGPAKGTDYYLDGVRLEPEMFDAAVRQNLMADKSENNWVAIRNSKDNAHSFEGPAIVYNDGRRIFCVHGVIVDEPVFEEIKKSHEKGIDPIMATDSRGGNVLRYEDELLRLHREDGPALIGNKNSLNFRIWAWHGQEFSTEEAWKVHMNKIKSETEPSEVNFVATFGAPTEKKDEVKASDSGATLAATNTPIQFWSSSQPSNFNIASEFKLPIPDDFPEVFKRAKADFYSEKVKLTARFTKGEEDTACWNVSADGKQVLRLYGADVYGGVWTKKIQGPRDMKYSEYFGTAEYGKRLVEQVRILGPIGTMRKLFDDEIVEADDDHEEELSEDSADFEDVDPGYEFPPISPDEIIRVEPIQLEIPLKPQAKVEPRSEMGLGGLIGMALAGGALAGLIDWKAKKARRVLATPPVVKPVEVPVVVEEPALARR